MKISGFTFIKNGIINDYPFIESINSILPLVDEFMINYGISDDKTLDLINGIQDSRIKIIESQWNPDSRSGGSILAEQTNIALSRCTGDWCLYLQGDEVVHEKYLDTIKEYMTRFLHMANIEALLFSYKHFYGSYKFYHDWKPFYRKEIRAFKRLAGITSYKDAQGFRLNGRKLRAMEIPAEIYHYGWVKTPEKMREKKYNLDRLWHADDWLKQTCNNNRLIFNKTKRLKEFTNSHPNIMQNRIKSFGSIYATPSARRPLQILGDFICRKILKRPIGEYKNYKKLKTLPLPMENPKKILITRLKPLGDTLLFTPVFRALKKTWPQCRITVIIFTHFKDAIKNNPDIDEIIELNRSSLSDYFYKLTKLFISNYDISIDPTGNPRSTLMTFIAHASIRIGFKNRRDSVYNYTLNSPSGYIVNTSLALLTPLNIVDNNITTVFKPSQESIQNSGKFQKRHNLFDSRIIGILFSAKYPTQKWPEEYFVSLAKLLLKNPENRILLIPGLGDDKIAGNMIKQIGANCFSSGLTGIENMAGFIRICSAIVTNDSGPKHLAVALDVPCVTIIGSVDPKIWNPPDTKRFPYLFSGKCPEAPCNFRKCEYNM
ncbi:MAG: glycosyltransferase family 9 protein, partial [bacterium]